MEVFVAAHVGTAGSVNKANQWQTQPQREYLSNLLEPIGIYVELYLHLDTSRKQSKHARPDAQMLRPWSSSSSRE